MSGGPGRRPARGQEIEIFHESYSRFGDIVYAKIGNDFFGYFLSSTGLLSGQVSTCFASGEKTERVMERKTASPISLPQTLSIRQIPLTGGPAKTLKVIHNVDIENSHRNLVTDGSFLYWQDDVSIHKMPITGGADTVLDSTSPNTPTAGLSLHGSGVTPLHSENVYYAVGNKIYQASILGPITPPIYRVAATASSRVTTLQVADTGLYWGEQSGAVQLKFGANVSTLFPVDNSVPTSISVDDGGAVATLCGSQSCELQLGNGPQLIGADAIGVTLSTPNIFWGDAAGVHELTFDIIQRKIPHALPVKKP